MSDQNNSSDSETKACLERKTVSSRVDGNPNQQMKVRFAEQVKVREYEDDDQTEMSEAEQQRRQEIVQNLFPELSRSDSNEDKSMWKIIAAMQDASARFASYAKDTLTGLGGKQYSDLVSGDTHAEQFLDASGNEEDSNEHKWRRNAPMGFTQKLEQYKLEHGLRPSPAKENRVKFYDAETSHLVQEDFVQPTESKELEIFCRRGTIEDLDNSTGRIIRKTENLNDEEKMNRGLKGIRVF